MGKVYHERNVLAAALTPGILSTFQLMNQELASLSNSLTDYLSAKRAEFPRLYFLSDTELQQMLSDNSYRPFIQKLFAGVTMLVDDGTNVVGVIGDGGEQLRLKQGVASAGIAVDRILKNFESTISATIVQNIRDAITDPSTPLDEQCDSIESF